MRPRRAPRLRPADRSALWPILHELHFACVNRGELAAEAVWRAKTALLALVEEYERGGGSFAE